MSESGLKIIHKKIIHKDLRIKGIEKLVLISISGKEGVTSTIFTLLPETV